MKCDKWIALILLTIFSISMNEDEISADMSNSLRIAVDDIVVVERTKLNPKISHKKKSPPHADYINTIKLASKGYK